MFHFWWNVKSLITKPSFSEHFHLSVSFSLFIYSFYVVTSWFRCSVCLIIICISIYIFVFCCICILSIPVVASLRYSSALLFEFEFCIIVTSTSTKWLFLSIWAVVSVDSLRFYFELVCCCLYYNTSYLRYKKICECWCYMWHVSLSFLRFFGCERQNKFSCFVLVFRNASICQKSSRISWHTCFLLALLL